jgi:hypothetical protein
MPRKAPTEIIETRISFGNFERQFVTEIKTDIENAAKVALIGTSVATVGTGLVVAGGVGYMGYFIMKGLQGFSLGIDDALDPLTSWYRNWFTFTNATTGKRESVLTNWYDYTFNNMEANQARADNPLPSAGGGDIVVEMFPPFDVFAPDEQIVNENTGGKGTADYEKGKGSNWPFTEDWWPF